MLFFVDVWTVSFKYVTLGSGTFYCKLHVLFCWETSGPWLYVDVNFDTYHPPKIAVVQVYPVMATALPDDSCPPGQSCLDCMWWTHTTLDRQF